MGTLLHTYTVKLFHQVLGMARSSRSRNIRFTDELLGEGGFGRVHVGQYKRQKVAVKIIQSNLLEKCGNEIELQKLLDHPNVVELLAVEEDTERNGSRYQMLNKPNPIFFSYETNNLLELGTLCWSSAPEHSSSSSRRNIRDLNCHLMKLFYTKSLAASPTYTR